MLNWILRVSFLAVSLSLLVSELSYSQDIAFTSWNYPKRYIRHRNGLCYIEEIPPGDKIGEKDATFRRVPGLAGKGSSFESVNFPRHFLRHQNFRLKLAKFEDTKLFREDATFNFEKGHVMALATVEAKHIWPMIIDGGLIARFIRPLLEDKAHGLLILLLRGISVRAKEFLAGALHARRFTKIVYQESYDITGAKTARRTTGTPILPIVVQPNAPQCLAEADLKPRGAVFPTPRVGAISCCTFSCPTASPTGRKPRACSSTAVTLDRQAPLDGGGQPLPGRYKFALNITLCHRLPRSAR
jgi:hypothetical protein